MSENLAFNFDQDYSKTPLFCAGKPGLFDTVNKQYPEIWSLYKQMKSLDWDENEVSYASCIADFEKCDKSTYDMMIKTLAFQWEADSIVSRLAPVVSPFISSSELWAAWQRISDNECLHSITYSEIVRSSFKDPSGIMSEILKVRESFDRLDVIGKIMHDTYKVSHDYALGNISDDIAYEQVFLFVCALLCLERIQFVSSFAVTFAIADTGLFEPIGAIVQKIAQDEFEIHVELDKVVIRNELKTERGLAVFNKNKELINKMIDEVVLSEMVWSDYLFSEGRSLVGMNKQLLKAWACYNAKDVYNFLGLKPLDQTIKLPASNPLPFMEDWLNISKKQPSPQEQDVTQYKTNVLVSDDDGIELEI